MTIGKFFEATMSGPSVHGMQTIVLAGKYGFQCLDIIIENCTLKNPGRGHREVLTAAALAYATCGDISDQIRLVQVPVELLDQLRVVTTPCGEQLDWTNVDGGWDRTLSKREIGELIDEVSATYISHQRQRLARPTKWSSGPTTL